MAHVIVRHKVKDYQTWKTTFDNFADARKAAGEKSYQILHLDDNPNNVVGFMEFDSLENARRFFDSSEVKETMGNAGVIEQPDIYFLEEYIHGIL